MLNIMLNLIGFMFVTFLFLLLFAINIAMIFVIVGVSGYLVSKITQKENMISKIVKRICY